MSIPDSVRDLTDKHAIFAHTTPEEHLDAAQAILDGAADRKALGPAEALEAGQHLGRAEAAAAQSRGRRTDPDAIIDISDRYRGPSAHPPTSLVPVAANGEGRNAFCAVLNAHFGHLPPVGGHGWKRGEYVDSITRQERNPKFMNAMQLESTGSAGGYLVPDQLVFSMLGAAAEQSSFWVRARFYAMTSSSLAIATLATEDRSSGAFAGLQAEWLAEAQTATDQAATFRTQRLIPHKLAVYGAASSEVAEDAIGLERALTLAFGEAIAGAADRAVVWGNGAGQPLGFMNSPALITVAAEAGQPADTVVLANLAKMLWRLHPAVVRNAAWYCHPSVVPQLLVLDNSAVGLSGAAAPVAADGSLRLFGLPLVLSTALKPLGDVGDIVLAAMSEYAVGLRREVTMQRSIDAGWQQDVIKYRSILRFDGKPTWVAPVTPPNSAATLSAFICLASR